MEEPTKISSQEKRRQYIKAWRERHPGIQRAYYLKKNFGLLPADVEKQLQEQNNTCPDCQRPFGLDLSSHPFFANGAALMLCLSCKSKRVKAPVKTELSAT